MTWLSYILLIRIGGISVEEVAPQETGYPGPAGHPTFVVKHHDKEWLYFTLEVVEQKETGFRVGLLRHWIGFWVGLVYVFNMVFRCGYYC